MSTSSTTSSPSTARDIDVVSDSQAVTYSSGHATRTLLRRCTNYLEAQRVVDFLSDNDFPVENTAIVARNISFVEHVTGTMNAGKAFLRGAGSGAFSGLMIGFILGLFVVDPAGWLTLLAWTTGLGALLIGLMTLFGYWSQGGQRDFATVGSVSAESFDVLVEQSHKDKAEAMLAEM
ncbi:MAG: hypothetical protein Fues2KO_53980 [Fuerstiella sp.]